MKCLENNNYGATNFENNLAMNYKK